MISFKNNCLWLFSLMMCVPILVQAAPAGNVIFASGDAQIIGADGKARAAAKNAVVNEGDTLLTGKTGAMQIRMTDAGFIAVRPDTRLTVQSFIWNGKEDGAERSLLSLVRGGFRTITGVIGRRSKDNYQVATPTATIGIRGTDHEPHYIAPIAPGETAQGEPGTYNKVNVGATFIRNASGTVELGPNQAGFASATPGRVPVRLSSLPGFMRNVPAPLGAPDRSEISDDDSDGSRRQAFMSKLADWVDGDEDRKRLARVLVRFAVKVAGSDIDLSNLVAGLSVAPPGTAVVGGFTAPDVLENSGLVVSPGNNTLILLGPNNRPFFLSDPGPDGLRYSRDTAPLVDSGEAGINGTAVNWGIYAGGSVFTAGGAARTPHYFYFMGTGNVTSPGDLALPGAAGYNTVVGFTKPINEAGQLGGNVNLSVAVTFGAAPRITSYNLGVRDAGGRTWGAMLNSPSMLLTNFANGGAVPNLDVNCTGAGCAAGTTAGKAAGFVIGGANRDGFISSYALKSGTASVTGAVAVK